MFGLPGDKPRWRGDEEEDWPNAAQSAFVRADGIEWHIQRFDPPTPGAQTVLLLHGTGAATHSWRDIAPALAQRYGVLALDLPGHGFTSTPWFSRLSLPGMTSAISALLQALDIKPCFALGHSAGAAIALRLALDDVIPLRAIISVNGALLPFQGAAGQIFPALAKLLFVNPVTPRLFALGASSRASVARLLRETGSSIEAREVDQYARLLRTPGHVAGALGMMANWDLAPLLEDLPRLSIPVLLATGDNDQSVPPSQADQIAQRLSQADRLSLPGLGHLAHEERPDLIVTAALEFLERVEAGFFKTNLAEDAC